MKRQVTMSIDAEVAIQAKERFGNLSSYVEGLLRQHLQKPVSQDREEQMEAQLRDLTIKMASIKTALDHIREERKEQEEKVTV